MKSWQVDLYRRPLQDQSGHPLWELILCDPQQSFTTHVFCPQAEVTAAWLTDQLQRLASSTGGLPDQIQGFRPQTISLLQAACQPLGVTVEPTRHTAFLKQILRQRARDYPSLPNYTHQPYAPVELDKPPPLPLPENLWGDRWQFAALTATDLVPAFQHRSIPIRQMPESRFPFSLNLPSSLAIPGVVIDAGRRSMQLARWVQQTQPYALNYMPGSPDGLLLEAGLVDRWILHTFEDPGVIAAAQTFRERQQAAKGLHFLLVQPDNSGMTYSGFWLLQREE
jgi:RNA-binding protein Tab2/Atab2